MEKLLKMLNEYQKKLNRSEENKRRYEIYERELHGDNIYMKDLDDPYEGLNMYGGYAKARLISKQFGFIKRLVDNDKINREQKTKEFRLQIEIDDGRYGELGGEDRVLLLLAISDNPIEDLISYLK